MAKVMNSVVTIGNFVFKQRVNSVQIVSSRKNLSNTATIKLANLKGLLEREIKVGDAVVIELGYDGVLNVEFEGYVSKTNPNIPFEVECEDEMWQLKQRTFHKSYASVSLKNLLLEMIPGADVQVPDITLSPFRISQDVKSVFEVLEKLKSEYGIDIFYRRKTLVAGLAYSQSLGTVNYSLERNCKGNKLSFKKKEDVKIKVKAINISPDNKRTTYELGDTDGETRTLHFYNKKESEIKEIVKSKINLMKYDGYSGSIMAFGIPVVDHGVIARIIDVKYPERETSVYIDEVTTTYDGSNGFKREIELGRSATSNLIVE